MTRRNGRWCHRLTASYLALMFAVYCDGMVRTALKWGLRLAVLAALASAVARLIESTSRQNGPEGVRVLGGDSWPPVPRTPARES